MKLENQITKANDRKISNTDVFAQTLRLGPYQQTAEVKKETDFSESRDTNGS
tara:strand:+ start:481 stop:636 length:156 start_codon:yes stop_codon:yes gene_type:complete